MKKVCASDLALFLGLTSFTAVNILKRAGMLKPANPDAPGSPAGTADSLYNSSIPDDQIFEDLNRFERGQMPKDVPEPGELSPSLLC